MYNLILGYVLDGFPSLCEDWLSMADQLDLVKNLPLTPDFIINLKVGTSNLDCHVVVVLFDTQIGTWSHKEQPPASKQSGKLRANSCMCGDGASGIWTWGDWGQCLIVGSITSHCSGKWGRTHDHPLEKGEDQIPNLGHSRNRALVWLKLFQN